MVAGVFRGPQLNADSVRRLVSRGSGCCGRALGEVGPAGTRSFMLAGIPVAPVSSSHHMAIVCAC